MAANTCYARSAFTRKRVRIVCSGYEFIERRRVWDRVGSRCDGETLFPEIFLPRQVGRKPLRKRSYYFPFHDAPRYACLHAEREKRRTADNGGRIRWESCVWETFVCYLVSRAARISADSLVIILLERSHANEESRFAG